MKQCEILAKQATKQKQKRTFNNSTINQSTIKQ